MGPRSPVRYLPVFILMLLILVLLGVALYEPVAAWLAGEARYDRDALIEWIEETRNSRETLPEMIDSYLQHLRELEAISPVPPQQEHVDFNRWEQANLKVSVKQEELYEHLQMLGTPPTKIYPGQMLLFPTIYRLEVRFQEKHYAPIIWDSEIPIRPYTGSDMPQPSSQYKVLRHLLRSGATVVVVYQLHAYRRQQRIEEDQQRRIRQVLLLLGMATLLTGTWLVLMQRRESERERQRTFAHREADEARLHQEETERKLLEQRLAAQAAEQRVLELRSQLYASIGIMAGSYAHNIKNLLVRPNDLLQRCLETTGLTAEQVHMLGEVRQTLGMVTERLQQILRTVRRDPGRAERARLDLNAMLRETERTWVDLARDKWKLDLSIDLAPEALALEGDSSHLQQTVENLLFNARDATFEMRNHLRNQARADDRLDAAARRQAVITAAGWKGQVVIRTRKNENEIILEVTDNGIGMTEEVRRSCTQTHFTTKRDNALYEGHNTGMGLGLAFVTTILEHHRARMEILSEPYKGALFRIHFPLNE